MADPRRDWKWTFRDLSSNSGVESLRELRIPLKTYWVSSGNTLEAQNHFIPHGTASGKKKERHSVPCRSRNQCGRTSMQVSKPGCDFTLTDDCSRSRSGLDLSPMYRDGASSLQVGDGNVATCNRLCLTRVSCRCFEDEKCQCACDQCLNDATVQHNSHCCDSSDKNSRQVRTRLNQKCECQVSVRARLQQSYNDFQDGKHSSGLLTTFNCKHSNCDKMSPFNSSAALGRNLNDSAPYLKNKSTHLPKPTKYVPNKSLVTLAFPIHTFNYFLSTSVETISKIKFPTCSWLFILITLFCCLSPTLANHPPRFLINGQTEIVIRLKEGSETPIGTLIYRLRGVDPDGDPLTFGIRDSSGSDVIRLENLGTNEANLYLNKELDREMWDEYMMVLTLTDGRLGDGNFITQSLLLLVEDVNDNEPVFKRYQASVSVREDAAPGILTTLEATDADEGPYGQVFYYLQENDEEEEETFSVSTVNGKGVVRLIGRLDYERKSIYQLRILAVDRSNNDRVNSATAALVVKVIDVEDQPPEFVVATPVTRISEDSPIGTSVLQVKAVDGDRGVNNKISYTIVSGGRGMFQIDNAGKVTTTKAIDREVANNGAFILQIQAKEESKKIFPSPSISTEVTIIVEDVNDETPTFFSDRYVCRVNENAQANTPITFLPPAIPQVYDHDQGNNGTFEMFLDGDNGIFEVTPHRGVNDASFLIRVKDPTRLDYEEMNVINFTLIAKETVPQNAKFSKVPVTVYIHDMNDNFPEFSKPLYEASVLENSGLGTTVAVIYARDLDSGNYGTEGIRYTNLGGSVADLLSLDPMTGVITIKSEEPVFDRELIPRHYLTVEARDDLGLGNRNTVQLVLTIEDVNDNAPIFLQSRYETRIMENELNFESPLVLEARDNDLNGTRNSEIRYSLVDWNPSLPNFTVDPVSGELKPSAAIDFESLIKRRESNRVSSVSVRLRVKAEDGGRPPLSTLTTVTIHIVDVNDHAPVFTLANYSTEVPEDIPPGTSILKLEAIDGDGSSPNNAVVYRLGSGGGGKFSVGAETGVVRVASGLEPGPRHTMTVLAVDGGLEPRIATATVTVTVIDVNNQPPVLTDPGSLHIKENTPVGKVVYQVRAVDGDGSASLRYNVDWKLAEGRTEEGRVVRPTEVDLQGLLSLHPTSGTLTLMKPLDREAVETIRLPLQVQDIAAEKGPQIVTGLLNIIIEDENDNNPVFRKPFYRHSITENSHNGITIANIVADDADKNRTITYALQSGERWSDLVQLDSATGELVVGSRIDREVTPWLNLTVKATDSGVPPRSAFVDVFIQVLDENDNNPYFTTDISNITLLENVTVGTTVARIEARDSDSGDYGKITYLLDRRTSEGKFQINSETGVLNVTSPLNREEKDSYMLIIQAWDNYQFGYASGESRNAFKQIMIRVGDVNDEVPVFTQPGVTDPCIAVTEFHEPRDTITLLKATDADDPTTPNGQLLFSILDGNDMRLFELERVDSWSAAIVSVGSLKGRYGNHSLTVEAKDLGSPARSAIARLDICITDFNDNAPVFTSPSRNTTIRIPENATVGSFVLGVEAEDYDVGQNALVGYRLKPDLAGDYRTFTIDTSSGVITLKLPLDREVQKIYQIRVEAYDHGVPTPLSSDLDLTIYVRNINDYQPQFLVEEFLVKFTEHAKSGVERRKIVDTVDKDELDESEVPAPVCYYIIAGNEDNLFNLEPLSHQITTNGELDREVKDQHELLVKASEDCLHPPKLSEKEVSSTRREVSRSGTNQSHPGIDSSILRLIITVQDINDNPPLFSKRVFTGGITTDSDFGTQFMQIKAVDGDAGENAQVAYTMVGEVRVTLSEGMDEIPEPPFLVESETGLISLNFDPQREMKGYFDFSVMAKDPGGLSDTAHVFIYLLREDQRVRFVLRQHPPELRENIDTFRDVLGNVTGVIVNVDIMKVHETRDGRVDKTRTDLYLHFVDPLHHSILEVPTVLNLIDHNIEHLDTLFKEFNVLDTGGAEALVLARTATEDSVVLLWLAGTSLFLLLLLIIVISLALSQRSSYRRQLKAATVTAFAGTEAVRTPSRVPNTNKHSVEGSNPMWMQAYENDWYKDDSLSHTSERDSLDENAVVSSNTASPEDMNGDSSCNSQSNMLKNECPISKTVKEQNDLNRSNNANGTYHRNLYQHMEKIGNPIITSKKLETTEL